MGLDLILGSFSISSKDSIAEQGTIPLPVEKSAVRCPEGINTSFSFWKY